LQELELWVHGAMKTLRWIWWNLLPAPQVMAVPPEAPQPAFTQARKPNQKIMLRICLTCILAALILWTAEN